MQLNYRIRVTKNLKKTIPIIMIHGLFGSLDNLGAIATSLAKDNCVIQVDLRNHGHSPHAKSMTYVDMAKDILELLDQLLIKKCIVIGHSMGGKVAMMLCMLASHRISKIIVIDIAPVQYNMKKYNNIFNVIEYINKSKVINKNKITQLMQQYISDKLLIAFLLKSFYKGSWRFNFSYIKNNYYNIGDWNIYFPWWGPTLYIKGENSSYLHVKYTCDIYHQFPKARIFNVLNAGHWVHFENPTRVFSIIKNFILNDSL